MLNHEQRSGVAPTIYLFVVDTCQDEDNLQALKVPISDLFLKLSLHYSFFSHAL